MRGTTEAGFDASHGVNGRVWVYLRCWSGDKSEEEKVVVHQSCSTFEVLNNEWGSFRWPLSTALSGGPL